MGDVPEACNISPTGEPAMPTEGNSAYSLLAFSKMNVFRKRGQLCDVVIKVGGQEFLAHRVVLAATSDYFDAMFSNGMAESAQLEVELKSISPTVMDALLDYVYTGQVNVTMDNVQDLLPAASLVQMEGVKTACSNFLLAEVDASNVLGIRRFAELHSCADLETFARNYAAHNFETVTDHDEFLCLNHEELLDLVTREDLHIDSEESVYMAVMRWVYHQAKERSVHLFTLLRNIRLPVLSVRFLTDVVDKDQLIRQSLECRDLVDDAKRFHLRPDLRHEMRERRYRQRDGGDEYLVVIGGFGSDQNPSDSVEMFNPRTLEWSELPDLPISYRYVAACSLDTCVYVIGGFDGRERLNTVCLLDIAQRDEGWRWLTSMHYKRGLSAACTHKGLIYVCGGFDGQSRLRSLEVYHPKIDEWRILEDMTTAREGAGLVVVDETLYCLGGYDGFHLLNSMEAFDLGRGTWSVCKPMYMRRSGAGCALLGDTIYVCGGYGGAEGRGPLHLDTVEAYNTRLAQWTLVTSMNVPRCYVGACPLAGKIYVAAGYNGSRLLDTVESYDPIENVWWLHDDSRMNHERCDTGMCVVRFLSCAEPFNVPSNSSGSTTAAAATSSRVPISAPTGLAASTTPSSVNNRAVGSTTGSSTRPAADSATTSSYRIPMLPIPTHLREGLSGMFRPNPEVHTSLTGQLARALTTLTHSRTGVPSSTALSVGAAASRSSASSSSTTNPIRAMASSSLRMHPHLPVRHQPNPSPNAQTSLAPGSFGPPRDFPLTRISPSPFPRTTRQLLAVAGVTPTTTTSMSNRWNEVPFNPILSGLPGSQSEIHRALPSARSDTSSVEQQPSPDEPAGLFFGSEADGAAEVGSTITPNGRSTTIAALSAARNSSGSTNDPATSQAAQYVPGAMTRRPGDSYSHSESRAMARASHSTSPPCLSRIMYHSAPETGLSSSSSQPHPMDELFRSAEALNFLAASDYRLWLDGGSGDPPPLNETNPALSSSNSELSSLEPGFRSREAFALNENGELEPGDQEERRHEEEQQQHEEEEDDDRDIYENDSFDTNPVDTLFSYLHIHDEHSIAEPDPGLICDVPPSTSTSSSASDAEFENTESRGLAGPDLLVTHMGDLNHDRSSGTDCPVGSSGISSSSSTVATDVVHSRSSLPVPQPPPVASLWRTPPCPSGVRCSPVLYGPNDSGLGFRSAFRATAVHGPSGDPGSESASYVRHRTKLCSNQPTLIDQRWPRRYSADERRRLCGQNTTTASSTSASMHTENTSTRSSIYSQNEVIEDQCGSVPVEFHPSSGSSAGGFSRTAQAEVIPMCTASASTIHPDSGLSAAITGGGEGNNGSSIHNSLCPVSSDTGPNIASDDQSVTQINSSSGSNARVIRAADSTHLTDEVGSGSLSPTPASIISTPAAASDQLPTPTADLEPAPETRSDGEGEEEEEDGEELPQTPLRSADVNGDDVSRGQGLELNPGMREQNQAVGQTDSN